MSENFKKLPNSRVAFELKIEKSEIERAKKKVLEKFKNEISVRGFRRGHAPENLIIANVGAEKIALEAMNSAINSEYQKFLRAEKIVPISRPKIEMKSQNADTTEFSVEVEIFPQIEIGDWKKIKIDKIKISVEKKEIDKLIESVLFQFGAEKKVTRAVKNGDAVKINFSGKDEKNEPVENTDGKNFRLRIGDGKFLPDFESALVGMKTGEKKEKFPVKFPQNYAPNLAGKKIFFDAEILEIGEISIKNLDEKVVEKISRGQKKSVDEFLADVENSIKNQKFFAEKQKKIREFENNLEKISRAEIPDSWLENEVAAQISRLKSSPEFLQNEDTFWKKIGKNEAEIKKEFRENAAKNLRIFLALSKIVADEKISLEKNERDRAAAEAQKICGKNPRADFSEEQKKIELNFKINKFLNERIK